MEPDPNALERVRTLLSLHRLPDAEREARRYLAAHPADPEGHGLLALVLSDQTLHRPAEASARQAVALSPDDPVHHWRLGIVLGRGRSVRIGLPPVREALALDPWIPEIHVTHSEFLLLLNDGPAALSAAEAALELAPEMPSALVAYARAARAMGRTGEARAVAETALSRSPGDPDAHLALGWAALHEGDSEQAIRAFREALRLAPTHPPARLALLEALRARSGPYARALRFSLWLETVRGPRIPLDGSGLVIALVVLMLGVVRSVPHLTWIALIVLPVVFGALGIVAVARQVSDTLLLLDRENRHIFTPQETRKAIASATLIGWVVATALLWVLLGVPALLTMLGVGFVLVALYPAMATDGWLRQAVRGWAVLMAVVLVAGVAGAVAPAGPFVDGPLALALLLLFFAALVPCAGLAIHLASARISQWRYTRRLGR